MHTFNELVAIIRDRFPDLSPQFQAGAAFLLDNPDEVAVLSMRKVAERAKVQPAAMVRLSQLLGFPGWNELREIFVSRVRTRPEPLTTRARSLVKGGSGNQLSRELAQAQSHNLELTLAQNAGSVVETAKTLKKAPHIHVAGFRSCYPVAFSLLYGYRLFRPSVSLVSGEAGTLEMQLRGIERKHAVVVVSFAPYSVEALRVAQAAVERGAKLVALTDSAVSPIALNADHTLIFSHESPSFFPSLVAASALAEMLVAHLLALEGKDAITNLQQAETALHSQGAYAAS
ncbi:MurR/RpiR family transcriptional regulator [Paraburkholderia strydomiana]|uniref:MurR/RpiR family transcriptional regulator n=1 Tax=Paraburkholderia strydomiana TaxID=1245417 RepID=UPI00285D7CE4|nr:MurR/RpiR family transcriptional regulator [Paraburkholderia strydomiana]MDR7008464.1 DNA-binding MurR/RpiR family transcriptional regulator [Paraburkholderia strydomiana]